MAWKKKISGCFGAADLKFGGHPADRKHARELLVEPGAANASWFEFEQAARLFLQVKNCKATHIDAEIDEMKDITKWLE